MVATMAGNARLFPFEINHAVCLLVAASNEAASNAAGIVAAAGARFCLNQRLSPACPS